MTAPLLLAIDVGTQSVRAALVEPGGRMAASAGQPHDAAVPQPGWSEQDPAVWWAGVRATVGAVLAATPGAAARIAAIACCGQMHAPVPVDRQGRCLAPAVQLWNDKRCAGQVAAFAARPDAAMLAERAANPPAPAWIGFKAAWLRDRQPEAYGAAASLLTPKDFINLRLTGVAATDFSEASGSFLLDWRTRRYDGGLADALGVDLARLPPVHRSDAVIGAVTPEAAAATGLRPGTPVVAGGGDFPVSLLGAGVAAPGVASDITGTSNLLSLNADRPIQAPGVMNLCGAGDGWIPFTIIDAGGDSLKWARRAFADEATPYAAISTLAAGVPPGAEGLMFLPYLSGERIGGREGTRAQFRGLSARHGKAHLFRAVMEGVCLASRLNFRALRDSAPALDWLVATGGGANSPVWVQIKADMFDLPVAVPESTEAGLIGCAALAGVAAGLFADQAQAARALVRFARVVEPRPDVVERYDALAVAFEAVYREIA
jgi:xylulokinase